MTAYTRQQADLLHIIDGAIAAVSPETAMHNALAIDDDILTVDGRTYDLSSYARILVVGAGKAAAPMARALENILGDRLQGGMVVTKYGHGLKLDKTVVMESAHPVPDVAGEKSARELLYVAKGAGKKDLIFCLLSGGASAIAPAPHLPVTLTDKQTVTRRLLECGATINEVNAVRKHLSRFKGGHLAKAMEPATVITLIISDVVGDDLDVIGSGPTAPDESTFEDCLNILDKYELYHRVPREVTKLLEKGASGMASETIKSDDSCFKRVQNVIIAGNAMALEGAGKAAIERGYAPTVINAAMQGEAREVARNMMQTAQDVCHAGVGLPACLLAGGETTVTIRGKGKGGRNQEMALAAAIELSEMGQCKYRMAVACVGTDGSDGPTDAAGALVLPDTVAATEEQSLSARRHLADNNAYAFFTGTGTILKTGPTRTNVMDIAIILIDAK